MKKALLTIFLVSVIVFVSISFMAASCVVTPIGPGGPYLIQLINNSNHMFYLQIFENPTDFVPKHEIPVTAFSNGSISADHGDYVMIYDNSIFQYILLSPGFTSYSMYINSGMTFTIGSGSVIVTEGR